MAISYGNVGAGALIGGLAKDAGAAVAAQRAEELVQRIAEQREARRAQQEAIQLQLQAQRDMKMIDYQMELEKYKRSHEWEIEKMEVASRIDFEKEERAKAAKESEYQSKKKAILESDALGKEQKAKLAVALDMEYLGASGLAQQLMKPKTSEDWQMEQLEKARGTTTETGTTPTTTPTVGNHDLMVVNGQLLDFDLDKETQTPIDPTKTYSVTDTTGRTRRVIGSELQKGWDTDILAFHGEAPAPPSQVARPKVQEELQKKFMGGYEIAGEYLPIGKKEITQQITEQQINPELAREQEQNLLFAEEYVKKFKSYPLLHSLLEGVKDIIPANREQDNRKQELIVEIKNRMKDFEKYESSRRTAPSGILPFGSPKQGKSPSYGEYTSSMYRGPLG